MWFCELNAARTGTGHGPNPLSYAEMAAWAWLTGRRLRPAEVSLLRELDHTWLAGPKKDTPA